MIAISLPLKKMNWSTMSFASTLYLNPVLDLLMAKIPEQLQGEVRLGLQEALVNAAKHGNKLDPRKRVVVQFSATKEEFCWVISDQGDGFKYECNDNLDFTELPPDESEHGRGLCLLNHIFDRVHWNEKGTQVKLVKALKKCKNLEKALF